MSRDARGKSPTFGSRGSNGTFLWDVRWRVCVIMYEEEWKGSVTSVQTWSQNLVVYGIIFHKYIFRIL